LVLGSGQLLLFVQAVEAAQDRLVLLVLAEMVVVVQVELPLERLEQQTLVAVVEVLGLATLLAQAVAVLFM
jgi:hypothetical protein